MRLVYGFPGCTVPPDPDLLSADVLSSLAVAAEDAGWAGVCFDEHPIPPEYWRHGGDGHDAVDPFVALAAVAAATSRIRLFVFATLVAIRNPFLLAKTVATLDVLSKGRVELGMVAGYLPEEFEALGVPFEGRNPVFDETVEVMKLAWTGEPVTHRGSTFSAVDVCALPRPVQQPHPPLWIGGNSRLSLRRVVANGHGWMPLVNPRGRKVSRRTAPMDSLDDLKALRKVLDSYAEEAGRTDPIDVALPLGLGRGETEEDLERTVDELEEAGVGWLVIRSSASSTSEALSRIERVAERVMER